MSISAVVLFGSRARGDHTQSSDTDLLMVTNGAGEPRHSSMGSVSLSFYQLRELRERALAGDLFVWHVLFEGRALYDPSEELPALRAEFRLRSSYGQEIAQGAALAWLLARFSSELRTSSLAARRATWAMRTVLIARAAEQGQPRFAASRLIEMAPIPETSRLLQLKSADGVTETAAADLKSFLTWAGLPDPAPQAIAPEGYADVFARTRNTVGMHFLRHRHGQTSVSDYVADRGGSR